MRPDEQRTYKTTHVIIASHDKPTEAELRQAAWSGNTSLIERYASAMSIERAFDTGDFSVLKDGFISDAALLADATSGDTRNLETYLRRDPLHFDPFLIYLLFMAIQAGHEHFVIVLCRLSKINMNAKIDAGYTPLHYAIFHKQYAIAKQLLELGASPNIEDRSCRTPLAIAILQQDYPMVDLLLHAHATMTENLRDGIHPLDHRDYYGVTALYMAAEQGDPVIVTALIQAGASVNQPVRAPDVAGSLPLHVAAYKGHTDAIKILLKCGSAWDASNDSGITPLAIAAVRGHIDVVKLLLPRASCARAVRIIQGWQPSQAAKAEALLQIALEDSRTRRSGCHLEIGLFGRVGSHAATAASTGASADLRSAGAAPGL